MVVILDLDAVVGVDAAAIRDIEVVMTEAVIVGDDVYPWSGSPLDLPAETFPRIRRSVRLPAIDDPRFDLEVRGRENLDANTLEKPRCIGGNVRRLISPVIEVVIAEQADVG